MAKAQEKVVQLTVNVTRRRAVVHRIFSSRAKQIKEKGKERKTCISSKYAIVAARLFVRNAYRRSIRLVTRPETGASPLEASVNVEPFNQRGS